MFPISVIQSFTVVKNMVLTERYFNFLGYYSVMSTSNKRSHTPSIVHLHLHLHTINFSRSFKDKLTISSKIVVDIQYNIPDKKILFFIFSFIWLCYKVFKTFL